MLARFLARRREFRERVEREANALLTEDEAHAYMTARHRARAAREAGDAAGARLWSKVAVEIARRTGQDIGIKGADRYPNPGPRPKPVPRSRREIADRLVEISRGIVALSAGRGDASTLHNIGVEARQILDFTGRTEVLEKAVADVIAAAEAIPVAPTVESLHAGVYPPAAEEAARALLGSGRSRLRSIGGLRSVSGQRRHNHDRRAFAFTTGGNQCARPSSRPSAQSL